MSTCSMWSSAPFTWLWTVCCHCQRRNKTMQGQLYWFKTWEPKALEEELLFYVNKWQCLPYSLSLTHTLTHTMTFSWTLLDLWAIILEARTFIPLKLFPSVKKVEIFRDRMRCFHVYSKFKDVCLCHSKGSLGNFHMKDVTEVWGSVIISLCAVEAQWGG